MDQTEVILVVPKLVTQPWYNTFQGMLSQEPYVVNPHKENVLLPQKPDTFFKYSPYMSKWFKFTSFNKVSPVEPL